MFACLHFAKAQGDSYKVLIDVTSPDTMVHKMVMRWVTGITTSDPDAEVEVVFYAGALDMILSDKSVVREAMLNLYDSKQVHFKACEMTLKRHEVSEHQLVKGVTTVPDAIREIVTRQSEGWGYIKASR